MDMLLEILETGTCFMRSVEAGYMKLLEITAPIALLQINVSSVIRTAPLKISGATFDISLSKI